MTVRDFLGRYMLATMRIGCDSLFNVLEGFLVVAAAAVGGKRRNFRFRECALALTVAQDEH
jgi:hypothetical protein